MSVITKEWLDKYFWPKVSVIPGSCWEWQAQRLPHGYGQIHVKRSKRYPHRLLWEYYNGPIPFGMRVLHSCDNPPCVNPAHLFLGTAKDNTHDMIRKGRDASTGEKQWQSKLTSELVRYIQKNYFKARSKRAFALRLGISPSHCCGIAYGRFWKHLQNLKRG